MLSTCSLAMPLVSRAPRATPGPAPRRAGLLRPERRPASPGRGCRRAAAAGDNDVDDVDVFRFTLGSDTLDALVPRVVGVAGAALLLVNHVLAAQAPSQAQLRDDVLGAALAALACAAPAVERRLKELQPGRGRQAAASCVAGATSVFALPPHMPDTQKQELAWASYALLLNTNICGLAVFWGGQAVLARGQLGVAAPGGGDGSSTGALAMLSDTELAAASMSWRQGALYCRDRASMDVAGAASWACVPAGAASVLVQPLLPLRPNGIAAPDGTFDSGKQPAAGAGVLLLLSERPRALSPKERAWVAAVAAKVHRILTT